MALIAAIGFIIAYAWEETILKITENTAINLSKITNMGYSPLYMPLLTTFLGVIIILILSKVIKS